MYMYWFFSLSVSISFNKFWISVPNTYRIQKWQSHWLCIGMVLWDPLYSSHSLVYQINFFLRIFPRVQYISFYVPYFVYCMLIKINVCFVYLGTSLLVKLTMHIPLSVFKPLFYTVLCYVSKGSIDVVLAVIRTTHVRVNMSSYKLHIIIHNI